MFTLRLFVTLALSAALLSACVSSEESLPPSQILTASSFADIPEWQSDSHQEALIAFGKSCARIAQKGPQKSLAEEASWGTYGDWQSICAKLVPETIVSPEAARYFFETNFTPYRVSDRQNEIGLFTGYYEPMIAASETQEGTYQTPIYARPADLVMVNLGEFMPELKGKKIAGRVKEGYLKPYEDRAAIEDGKLPETTRKILFWASDPVDVFFLQIQGSGVVMLPSGKTQRIGYDGQNGYSYTAIGKELVARGAMTKEETSMQSIRAWLATHPQEGRDLMRLNKSYTFFRLLDTDGPVGAEGTVLTAGRSMAVDPLFIPYGVPIFLDAEDPLGVDGAALRRLVVAQDTGGAIKGVVRGDMFWGHGNTAAHTAGLMKSKGRMWVLLPRRQAQKD